MNENILFTITTFVVSHFLAFGGLKFLYNIIYCLTTFKLLPVIETIPFSSTLFFSNFLLDHNALYTGQQHPVSEMSLILYLPDLLHSHTN